MMLAAGLVAGVPAQPAVATPAGPDATVTVEAALHDQLAEYGTADFWVYLKPQADLTGAASLAALAPLAGWWLVPAVPALALHRQTRRQIAAIAGLAQAKLPLRTFRPPLPSEP